MRNFKIINLPDGALSVMKGVVKSDGTVLDINEAFSLLADYLILCEEPSAVYDISEFLSASEKEKAKSEIAKKAFSVLSENETFSYEVRKAIIERSLNECAKITDVLNFQGFMNFRTEEYIRLLYGAVFSAAEEYFAEKEYKEMTKLLKESIKYSDKLIKEAHIYGCFIFDEEGNELNKDENHMVLKTDKMLITLLSFCPERIYIHYPPEAEMLSAIEAVFSPNVIFIN